MKTKSLLVLLLAGIWGIGSWWWYTCKLKGFCGTESNAAQLAAGGAATSAGAAAITGSSSDDKKAEQEKADAGKNNADRSDASADKADQGKDGSDQAKAEQEKADAGKDNTDKAKTDADKAKADADKAKAEQEKADADKAKTDADKAKAEQEKADADKVTIQTDTKTSDGTIGPASLTFPTGSANPQLAKETQAYFEKVAAFLKDNNSAKVIIVGHTDNKGDPAKNKELGQKRADMLRDMLVKLGVSKERIETTSEGSNKPLADNNTEEGRKKNRRVEITPIK